MIENIRMQGNSIIGAIPPTFREDLNTVVSLAKVYMDLAIFSIDFLFDVNNHFRCAPSVCASFVRLFRPFTAPCLLSVTMSHLSIYSIR